MTSAESKTEQASPIASASIVHDRVCLPLLFQSVVDHTLDHGSIRGSDRGGGIVVATCGPPSLVRGVRRVVGGMTRAAAVKVGGVVVLSETFGW